MNTIVDARGTRSACSRVVLPWANDAKYAKILFIDTVFEDFYATPASQTACRLEGRHQGGNRMIHDHVKISLDQMLNVRDAGTYLVKVEGDSMQGAGIF